MSIEEYNGNKKEAWQRLFLIFIQVCSCRLFLTFCVVQPFADKVRKHIRHDRHNYSNHAAIHIGTPPFCYQYGVSNMVIIAYKSTAFQSEDGAFCVYKKDYNLS